MKEETHELQTLRTLILKSQSETLSEDEIAQLNELVLAEGGSDEAAALIDQVCALTDAGVFDSQPMAEAISEAFGSGSAERAITQPAGKAAGEASDQQSAAAEHPSLKRLPTTLAGADTRPVAHRKPPPLRDHEPQRSRFWNQTYWIAGLAASHLLIASLAWSLAKPSPEDRPVGEMTFNTTPPIATANSPQLVSMTACVWRASGDSVPSLDRPIELGEVLNLVEGIAELKVGEGTAGEAQVRIEGPASVFIRADGHIGLRHGSLTAKSLGTGSGQVTLDTPVGEIHLDGQSFIGLVSDGSVHEAHLFNGQATVQGSSAMRTEDIRLEGSEAVRFSAMPGESLEVVMFEASLSRFVSARSSGFDPLEIGEKYVSAVQESKPSIYWRFEELDGEFPSYVPNEGSVPGINATIIGESGWRRYGSNRVAELGKIGTTSGFRSTSLWPPKPLDEYTVELWVKPELYHHGEMFCMHESRPIGDGRYSHTMMLETLAHHFRNPLQSLAPNRIRFVHRSPASGEVSEGSNVLPGRPYEVRTWQHLAARKQGGQVSLWLDGREVARQADPKPLGANMQLVIGQLYLTRSERRFVGQIDEVAIYDRCLSSQELRAHIKAAGRTLGPREPVIENGSQTPVDPRRKTPVPK